jgi:pimeloyl-ACP methyl ester carboxylesterase
MKYAVIYIPGLSDESLGEAQRRIMSLWRVYNIYVIYQPMLWADTKPFSGKLNAILKDIDNLKASGYKVSILGTSAGGGAAINAFAARPNSISKVICISGKINNPQSVDERRYKKNPAFKESMLMVEKSLASLKEEDKAKILSLRPLHDGVVPAKDTIIYGASNRLILSVGHILGILYGITIGSPRIVRYIKSK